jgi:hypothetical protein
MKVFQDVASVLYVHGHTKNACDITCNHIKIFFHKKYIFTYNQAVDALGKKDNVTMFDPTKGVFKNYGALLEKYINISRLKKIKITYFFA